MLDDLVFVALISEFELIGIEAECRFGVVVEVEVHFLAYRSLHVQANVFLKVEGCLLACFLREGRVIDLCRFHAHRKRCRTLGAHSYATLAEEFFKRSKAEFHVEQVESFVFSSPLFVSLAVLIAVIGVAHGSLGIAHVFLSSHGNGVSNLHVTHHRFYKIAVIAPVELDDGLDVVWSPEVNGVFLGFSCLDIRQHTYAHHRDEHYPFQYAEYRCLHYFSFEACAN